MPAQEVERHRPGGVDDAGLTTGAVRLERRGDSWQLTFQTGETVHRVRSGEKLRYGSRPTRTEQDWLQFPVVAVTAIDAEAYTRWLDASGQLPGARLCSEHEWERASRGADARRYPHGDRLEPDDINFDQTYGKRPEAMGLDEVGSHPRSRSPFGIDDLAGNAFEWTTSSLDRGQYVLRGGSYFYDAATNRSTNRSVAVPSLRVASVGVRVCASATPRK